MTKVFLGGTCNDSQWRRELIKMLEIDYFDPVVDDWDDKAQANELMERAHADFCLYVITPAMTGVYSIAEAVDDSNKRPRKTLFCFISSEWNGSYHKIFDESQKRSLENVCRMVSRNGGLVFNSLEDVAEYLNKQ